MLASPFSPFPSFPCRVWLAWARAEAQEQLEGGGWDRARREGALRPRKQLALPQQLPTEFTAQKTPLVQQFRVEVGQGPEGQTGVCNLCFGPVFRCCHD